ncbi:MAG: hypothetical protein A2735_02645 [Candidatus Yanofskybacteria bacterium RIFCSPHIGHO2_01_FULL_41_21]|uniref:Uncharacterized protein n=1 Tax=Candidatus Yanofskybacteria bacterium RIFCSPHIGHO2_01_FULL_41_21 TaxID=1802660 RepID=A0A1F8EBB8_9BACT|nr:MAG: hypothetical protein A2735_02645 [Candidatus Yanofskybacteria bacterium RIFCSPHIGHO2_01_FULL_41_21]
MVWGDFMPLIIPATVDILKVYISTIKPGFSSYPNGKNGKLSVLYKVLYTFININKITYIFIYFD